MGFIVQFTDRVHKKQIIFAAPKHHHFPLLAKAGCVPQPGNQTRNTISAQKQKLVCYQQDKAIISEVKK